MKKIYLVGLSVMLASNFFAQEAPDTLNLEEITISIAATPKKDYVAGVQTLTIQEIKQLPVTSLNELLAYVGGVDIRQRGPMGTQADISIDGGTFEQTLVMINGVKLNNSQTAHNMLNLPIPFDAIKEIEIIKGSVASYYGINSLTGAVNIITKKEDYSFIEADIYAGSSFQKQDPREGSGIYGGGGVSVTGNYGTKKQSHLFSALKENSNGHRYNSYGDKVNLLYSGEYRVNKNNSIQLFGGYADNKFGANGFYAAPGDSNSVEFVKTGIVSLSSEHKFGRFSLSPKLSNRYDEDDYRYFKDNPSVARSMHYTNALMAELNGEVATKIGTFGLNLTTRFETINSSNIGNHDRNNYGAAARYFKTWKQLVFDVGAYVNYNTSYGWQVYPAANILYTINKQWTISAVASSGQRIPSFTDLFLNQAPGNVGNPNLRPENAWTYELNASYRLKSLTTEAGYFYRNIYDFIDWTRDSEFVPYSPENYGNVKVHGLYGRLRQSFVLQTDHRLGYFVNYQYLHPIDVEVDESQSKYVVESLKHQLIVGLNYSYKDLSVQLGNRLIQRELNKAYNLLDLRLSYKVKGITIYTDITNLLDAQYRESGAVPMPTRWYKLGVRYSFSAKK